MRNSLIRITIPILVLIFIQSSSQNSSAQQQASGPGLGNLTYDQAEVLKPLAVFNGANGAPMGQGVAMMHRGYLFVPSAPDSGKPGGGFSFYDISNPRSPQPVLKKFDDETWPLREPHAYGWSDDVVAMQSVDGVMFWDMSDVLNPVLLKHLDLPGIRQADYGGSWWIHWQAPYVYVAGMANGLLIVNASDPANPSFVNRIPQESMGFEVRTVFALGNLLVATSDTKVATFDISNPTEPLFLDAMHTAEMYSWMLYGDMLLGAGVDERLTILSVSDPRDIQSVSTSNKLGDKGGYLSVQDSMAHMGMSSEYVKLDLSDPQSPLLVGAGTSGISGRDEDFATVFGNLVLVGNDHGNGSALIPHQAEPDLDGPSMVFMEPRDGSVDQPLTSRIGVAMSDMIDLSSVSQETFLVRPVGGAPLSGRYSHQFGIINFAPDAPLSPNTTYEVILSSDGIRDAAGNRTRARIVRRFSTGPEIQVPSPTPTIAPTYTATATAMGDSATPTPSTPIRTPPPPTSTPVAPLPVIRDITAAPSSPIQVGQTVRFSTTVSTHSPMALEYRWEFDDGTPRSQWSTAAGESEHVFQQAGNYLVLFQVRTPQGQIVAQTKPIMVVEQLSTDQPVQSSPLLLDETRRQLWVVNPDNNTLTVIDVDSLSILREQPLCKQPTSISMDGSDQVWITCRGADQLWILDANTGGAKHIITLAHGAEPISILFAPDKATGYVAEYGTGKILQIEGTSRSILETFFVGATPRALAMPGDGSRLLVTRFISDDDAGTLWVIDPENLAKISSVELALDSTAVDTDSASRGLPNYLSSIAIHPNGKEAWVAAKKDNILRGLFRDGEPLNFENTVRALLAPIDLVTGLEIRARRIDINNHAQPSAILYSHQGNHLFAVMQGNDRLIVLDAFNGEEIARIGVGSAPQGVVIDSATGRIFVKDFLSRTVTVVDGSEIMTNGSGELAQIAQIATVRNEALPKDVLRGKQLFYNASDLRLAADGYMSCAACHLDGGHDGRTWDLTQFGEGVRNTIDLNGRSGTGHGPLHWTANFDEVQDFELQIRNLAGGSGLMDDAFLFVGTRSLPLGDKKVGLSRDLDAMATYVHSLTEIGRSPYRTTDGSLTESAMEGRELLANAGCLECHGGENFTASVNSERHDVGTIGVQSGLRLGMPLDGFDPPTLLGLWMSAPYLHDGSAPTLHEVFDNPKHVGHLNGDTQEKIITYLLQIDDLGNGDCHSSTDR